MSKSGSSAVDRGDDGDEECPICLEPLPPFWDWERRTALTCCGGYICRGCAKHRTEFLDRAAAEGSYGRQERQLGSTCPLCRTPFSTGDTLGKVMADRFEKGQLPLKLYQDLGLNFIQGQGGVERNVERGVEIWMLGAEKGDPNCQYALGMAYGQGELGLAKSSEDARRWYLAAAEQGHAIAECIIASMMEEEGNDAEYQRYIRSSASKGCDPACYSLGLAYYYGKHSLQKSTEEAIRVLTPAAERGNALSMCLLGTAMCRPDPQLPPPYNPSFTKGMQWSRRAAETGDQTAVTKLRNLEVYGSTGCFKCNKSAPPGGTFLRCSRCRAAWYCSKDCQVQHWKAEEGGHKQFCIKWANEAKKDSGAWLQLLDT